MASGDRIRVGIVGASPGRSWAALAHVPALQQLPDYELTAVSTTRLESAQAAAAQFGAAHAFASHEELVRCDAVDLVVVAVKVPSHHAIVAAALDAGKPVYCEWPLGNGLAEAEDLAARARAAGVRTAVGLQARAAPTVRYLKDLIAQGYVGTVLSTTLVGSGMNWGLAIDQGNAYSVDVRNGATMLTVAAGHTIDALCHCLGEIGSVSAQIAHRRDRIAVIETGETIPMTAPDQICLFGTLAGGAPLSVHYRGGLSRGVNMLWEINGTEGDIQVTADAALAQMVDLSLHGGRGEDRALSPLPVPDAYQGALPVLPGFPGNLLHAYARFAQDLRTGSRQVPDFEDALVRHRMIAAIESAAQSGAATRP